MSNLNGPKTALTPEIIAQVEALVPRLVYRTLVADALGVSRRTLLRWMAKGRKAAARIDAEGGEPQGDEAMHLSLLSAFKKGVATLSGDALAAIVKAFSDKERPSWQAAAWLLERLHPEVWASVKDRLAKLERQVAEQEKTVKDMAGGK